MRIIIVCLISLMLGGCASWFHRVNVVHGKLCNQQIVVVDSIDADPLMLNMLETAVLFWNYHAGQKILLNGKGAYLGEVLKDPPFIAIRVASTVELRKWREKKKENRRGVASAPGNISSRKCIRGTNILLNHTTGDNEIVRFNLLLHEIGHAIGLDHSIYPDTVMYHQISRSEDVELGPDTEEELKRLYQ